MNNGADFQQEPLALKQGQPRIFATGNEQDSQSWGTNGSQPSPGYMRGNQPQQELPTVYNNRSGDTKGKGVDRSGTDPMPGFQHQQQSDGPVDQRENQMLSHNQVGETPIRTVYTRARSPAMEYRENLERDWNRVGGNGTSDNKPAEPKPPPPSTHRPPARRVTEPHFGPPQPAPLRKNSSGSSNEPQQRIVGPRSHTADHQQTFNLNGENAASKLNRRQSLYTPVVAITTNVPDMEPSDEPLIPSPKTTRSFGQRSDSAPREPGRHPPPPAPSSFSTDSSPSVTNGHFSGEINGSSPEPPQNRDSRRRPVAWNVQSSTGSLSTQDTSRKASLTSNTSVSSDRERDRSTTVAEPQPIQNRPHKSTQPPRLDNGQTSPPSTHHRSRERLRTGAGPTTRESKMDSFYGGDASLSGMKKLSIRNGEETNRTSIDEEPELHFYPLELHLLHPQLLRALLHYLSFYDWCVLQGVNKSLRSQLSHVKELKDEILERYLSTIGYARWIWEEDEPLVISLRVKSSQLLPTIVLTRICRISANICAVFRYQHTSTPESQTTTYKHGLPPFRKRRR